MKYLSKTIEYGLYLFAFILPWQTRWIIRLGFTEYQTYSLYGTDILLILLLLMFIIYEFSIFNFQFSNNFQLFNFQTKAKSRVVCWFVTGLLLASAVSIFFASSRLLALYKFGWLALGAGLFWLIARAQYERVKLIWSLLFGLALQAMLASWQFLAQATFADKWLGLAAHRAGDLGTSVIETAGADGVGERWLRAYGGFDHPNVLGGVMAAGIILLVSELIRQDKINNFQFPISNFQTIFNVKIFKILSWLFIIVFSAALFFSFSRAAWLALGLGLAAGLIRAAVKKDLGAQKNLLQAILVSGLVGFILFFQFPDLVMTRLYAANRLEIKSTGERITFIKNSWKIIKNNWLFGVGAGNYNLADVRLNKEIICRTPDCRVLLNNYYQPVHNVFILVLSEIGITGFLSFIGLIIYLVIFNFQFLNPSLKIVNWKLEIGENNNADNLIFRLSFLTSLVVLLCLDHWLWSLHFGILFFWLIIGLIIRVDSEAA